MPLAYHRRRFPIIVATGWVAAVAIVGWLVVDGRRTALLRSERSAAAFSTVVEQQTVLTFQSLDLTLAAVADAHALMHPAPHDPAFQQLMSRRLKDIPFVRAIFVIGPDGRILGDTDHPATPDISLADRPYFIAHAQDPSLDSFYSAPVLSRSNTGWFVPVTRALGHEGRFEGVVVAAIQTDHFRRDFEAIGLDDGYSIALYHRDGSLVASYPAPADRAGEVHSPRHDVSKSPPPGGSTVAWSRTGDGLVPGNRVVSYRALKDMPFVVMVSQSRDDALAEWRRTAAGAAVAVAALTLFLAWFVRRFFRELAAREEERQRRVQAEKLEALGHLTAGISHDFANLLGIVSMSAELLRHGPRSPEAFDQTLGGIDRAVQTGTALINRLMSFARRRPMTLAPLHLDAWLREAHPLLAQAAGSRVRVAIKADAPAPPVLCDVSQLDVAVLNLIVNARDAMAGRGAITLRVERCARHEAPRAAHNGFVCLAVQDDGPGMPPEVQRHALEPFFTTKGESGTGLGLAQVYGFMQQLGGDVKIDTAPGGGTSIRLYFPIAPEARAPE